MKRGIIGGFEDRHCFQYSVFSRQSAIAVKKVAVSVSVAEHFGLHIDLFSENVFSIKCSMFGICILEFVILLLNKTIIYSSHIPVFRPRSSALNYPHKTTALCVSLRLFCESLPAGRQVCEITLISTH